jgi:hypothetical protein
MAEIDPVSILSPDQYREIRGEHRARMMKVRADRRARIGDQLVLAFENRDTLTYQIQEMTTVEDVVDAVAIEHEVAAYDRLLPTSQKLVATLFIENADISTVKAELARLEGIQRQIRLEIQSPDDEPLVVSGVEIPGPDEDGPSKITLAVHFLGFEFDKDARIGFLDLTREVRLVVEHPRYTESVVMPSVVRKQLVADLRQ